MSSSMSITGTSSAGASADSFADCASPALGLPPPRNHVMEFSFFLPAARFPSPYAIRRDAKTRHRLSAGRRAQLGICSNPADNEYLVDVHGLAVTISVPPSSAACNSCLLLKYFLDLSLQRLVAQGRGNDRLSLDRRGRRSHPLPRYAPRRRLYERRAHD